MEQIDVPQPILVEIHVTNSADEVEGPVQHSLVEDGKSIKKSESSLKYENHSDLSLLTDATKTLCDLQIVACPSKIQEKVGTMDVAIGCNDMSNKQSVIELEIKEVVLSSKDCNIHTDSSQLKIEEKVTTFDGQRYFCSDLESPSGNENDSGQVKFGDEGAPEIFEGSKEWVDSTIRYKTENWEVESNTKTNLETIECLAPTDVLVTSEQGNDIKTSINKGTSDVFVTDEIKSQNNDAENDISVGMEFFESDFAFADKLEAHAEFRKTCSSDPSRISSEISNSSVGVSSNTSKLEEDASTIDNFLVKKVRCRPEAIAAGAEMLTVKLDYSEDVLSEESDFNRITDCSLDGTTETISHLTLRDIECPSVHTYSSSTEEIASMQSNVQYLPMLQKKRIDLGYQPIQEIVDRIRKEGEINRENRFPLKVLLQRTRTNEMHTPFPQETMEERNKLMEKSLLVTRRGDMQRQLTQSRSNSSKSFDKAESVNRRGRRVGKGLLNYDGLVKDGLLPNKGRTPVDRAEVVLEGSMRPGKSVPVDAERNLIYQPETQRSRGDNAQLSSRGGDKYRTTKEFTEGQHSYIERAPSTAVGEAMHQELLHSVTKGAFHSESELSVPPGELQFQSGQARGQTDKHFESAHPVVRNDDLALKGNPRRSKKFHNKDHYLDVGEGKIGKFVKDNQQRFGPAYPTSSSRASSLQNEMTTYFDELDAQVGFRGPSGGTSKSSSSNEASSWRRSSVKGRNISQVTSAPVDSSFERVGPQSTKLSSEKRMFIRDNRKSHFDDSPSWVSLPSHEEIPAQGGAKGVRFQSLCLSIENSAPKLTFDAERQDKYTDPPKSVASNFEKRDSNKFVVNFDTKEQKRRIGYLNSSRESNVQKSSSNVPSVQQNDYFLESEKQTLAVKGPAGIARKTVHVAGSTFQPYQSQAASADEHPSNSIQKQRAVHGLAKSNDKGHLRTNFRDKAYRSPKGAPLYDAQDSVHNDWSDSSSVKPSLELSNSRSGQVIAMKQDEMTRITEVDSKQNVNVATTHDEYEDSWSSPSFPVNSLPKAKDMEVGSSKSRRWGDVVEEGDEMEFSPLEGKAQQNWEQGMAEYDGRVSGDSWSAIQTEVFNMPGHLEHHPETTNSSHPNAPAHKKNVVEQSRHFQSKMVSKDLPNNVRVSDQTPARKSVWERLGPREDAVSFSLPNMFGKTKSAGDDGLSMKPPYRSSNSNKANIGNKSYGMHVDHVQETHPSKIDNLPIGIGEAVHEYKDDRQRRGKLELYVPRRRSHNF